MEETPKQVDLPFYSFSFVCDINNKYYKYFLKHIFRNAYAFQYEIGEH